MSRPCTEARVIHIWQSRLRLFGCAAVVWALLQFLVQPLALPPGLDRAPIITGYGVASGLLGGLLACIVLIGGGWLAERIAFERPFAGIQAASLGLLAWVLPRGTVDQWLIYAHPELGPRDTAAYLVFLSDYLLLAIAFGGIWLIQQKTPKPQPIVREEQIPSWSDRLTTLASVAAIAAALMMVLHGPRAMETYRGQVIFAVGAGFALPIWIGRSFLGLRDSSICLLAPWVVGVLGLIWGLWRPALAPEFARLNIIPVSPLVRPLPVEMVAIGILAVLWASKSSAPVAVPAADAEPARG